jgi:hypothetical protein
MQLLLTDVFVMYCFLRCFTVCPYNLLLQVFEKFTKESTSLLDELALINNGSDKGNEQEKER